MTPNQKPPATHTAQRPLPNFIGFIGLILLCLSLYLNRSPYRSQRRFPFGSSAAFRGGPVRDANLPPDMSDATHLEPGTHVLTIPISDPAERFGLSFLYQCEPACNQVWLASSTPSAALHLPVYHPFLPPANWFHLIDQGLVLYQRQLTVSNLSELLAQPAAIAADAVLIGSLPFQPYHQLTSLEALTSLEGLDFLLTTRQPMADFGPWHRYQTILSAQSLKPQTNGELQLSLSTDQPLYLTHFTAGPLQPTQ